MDWISLLRSQQKDFLRRVKAIESRAAIFLEAAVSGCHTEQIEFPEDQYLQMLEIARQQALVAIQNISTSEKPLIQTVQQQIENYFYHEQVSEQILNFCFPQQFQRFQSPINLHNCFDVIDEFPHSSKFSYQLIAHPQLRLQIHIRDNDVLEQNEYSRIRWEVNQDDLQNHRILLFLNGQLHTGHNQQNVVLCGFLLPQFLDIHIPKIQVQPEQLLYSGGLTWCINWLQTQHQAKPQKQHPITTKTDTVSTRHPFKSLIGNWECWQTLTGHARGINCLALSSENLQLGTPSLLATGSRGEIKLWNLTRGELICTLSEYQWSRSGWVDEINCLTFSHDGRMLVSGSADSTIKIWHVGARDLLDILHEHRGMVRCMAFTPNQQFLATAGDDRVILFWDLRQRDVESRLSVPGTGVHALTFNANGDKLITGCNRQIHIWQTITPQQFPVFSPQPQLQINAHAHIVRVLATSPDGQYLVSASANQSIKIWRLDTGELIRTLTGHQDSIHAIAIAPFPTSINSTPIGHLIASGSADRTIKLWHLETGEHLATFRGHTHTVTALTFTASGEIIVSASLDKTIRIWQRSL